MNRFLAAIICVISSASLAWSAENDETIVQIFTSKGQLCLIDGELFCTGRFQGGAVPEVKRYQFSTPTFELRDAREGRLIVLRPKLWESTIATPQKTELDGLYVTADFSPPAGPTFKFTKEPEKHSYWQIEKPGARFPSDTFPRLRIPDSTVSIKDDNGNVFYWSLEPTPLRLLRPLEYDTRVSHGLRLSAEPKEKFRVQQIDLNDGK